MRICKLVIVVGLILTAATPILGAGPKISFEKEVHDYGRIRYGDTVTEEFVFTNAGDQTLIIEQLRASCGCTKAVKGSSEVAPSQSSKIVAAFDTTGLRAGKKEQSIFVHTNDPEKPVVKLTVLADVVKDLSLEPPNVARRLPGFVETVSFPMKITNYGDQPYTVKGAKIEAGGMRASLNPASFAIQPRTTVGFTLSLKLRNEPGQSYFMGQLHLQTDHPRESDIEVRYLIKLDERK